MGPAGPVLSGRAEERARLLAAVQAGVSGDPRVVLVHGEAGIGKTSLVRDVCAEVGAGGVQLLWGQCLRLHTVDAMFHPLVLALEGWLRTADLHERGDLLSAAPSAAMVLPSLGGPPPQVSRSDLMLVVAALVEHVVGRGPSVLVVDDVQWADPATSDALSYLVAGLASQSVALVTTHRDEGVVSEEFQRWLSHLRHLPRTEELELARLDLRSTAEQVAVLTGAASERLASQVFERSRGNPYLSELLVQRLDRDSEELPDEMPHELGQALLDAWRSLSTPAREVARALAIGGRPCDVNALRAIAAELGVHSSAAVREAVDAGVLVVDGREVWFRHPLLAAVLVASYLPGEDEAVHAAWARHLQTGESRGVDEMRRLGDLAMHHERSGDEAAAFAVVMAAARLAEELGAPRETADLLLRAVGLWCASPDPADAVAHARLLERTAHALVWVDREPEGRPLLAEARDLVQDLDPVLAGHFVDLAVMWDWPDVAPDDVALAELDRAIELTAADPDSPEHATALFDRAFVLFWAHREVEARDAAAAAQQAAERSGSDAAISHALQIQCYLSLATDLSAADELAEASWRHALAAADPLTMVESGSARYMVAEASGDLRRLLEVSREQAEWEYARGLVLGPSTDLAHVYLTLGDLARAEVHVRRGLAGRGSHHVEAQVRVLAGLLSARRGQLAAARRHLARAYEVLAALEERPRAVRGTVVADLLLTLGEPDRVVSQVEGALPKVATDTALLDAMLLRGVRALADLVQRADDGRDRAAVRRYRDDVDRLVAVRNELSTTPPFRPSSARDTQQPAHAALFRAEVARATGDRTSDAWLEAARACGAAGLEWEQRCAQLRAAERLVESGAPGREVVGLLRDVLGYAEQQAAAPLAEQVAQVAASARVSLVDPTTTMQDGAVPAPFTTLTPRESEVLAHLVANRTYAEIASELFISEKTVSVHVSNLLRKTGTTSRREVSALARRTGYAVTSTG